MMHLLAYDASIAQNSLLDVAAITDPVITVQNGHYVLQQDMDLLFAFAMGATIARARIQSPSNQQITLPFIRPVNNAAVPGSNAATAFFLDNPFRVKGLEEIEVDVLQTSAGAEREIVLLGLTSGQIPAPAGNEFTIRGTGTTTMVANSWTQFAVTWANILPAGRYACVGIEAVGVSLCAVRAIFENQVERPGVPGLGLVTSRLNDRFYTRDFGVYGYFRPTRMPLFEGLCTAADTAQEVYMRLIRVPG